MIGYSIHSIFINPIFVEKHRLDKIKNNLTYNMPFIYKKFLLNAPSML
jgi:hypothetical protein